MVDQHIGIATDMKRITLVAEIKMAATKPEVVTTRLICHLEMKFRKLCITMTYFDLFSDSIDFLYSFMKCE